MSSTSKNFEITLQRKTVQFITATLALLAIWRLTSFKVAVVVGLAVNSADMNETRERLSNLEKEQRESFVSTVSRNDVDA
jgi:hypothetical protein